MLPVAVQHPAAADATAATEMAGEAGPAKRTRIDAARAWLFGGNTVVRVGVVILFFGVAFFLGYVADRGWLPIELRLSGAATAGMALLAIGWRLRSARREYALALQGGGAGIVYLTAFAAVNFYDLIGATAGLGVMLVLVVLAAILAVTQDARSLAVLASLGGFLGPVLVSRDGSHVALFSYYAALDAGIVAVAWFRAWRVLNLLGFVFTFIVGTMWGFSFYQPEYFATTQPFLALFFALFVAVPVLYARRQPPRLTGYVDGTLVFGVPLAAYVLQHRADERLRVRAGVQRSRLRRVLRGRGRGPPPAPAPVHAGSGAVVRGAGRGVRHPGHPARRRRAVDLRRLGARRGRAGMGRRAAGPAPRPAVGPCAAAPRGYRWIRRATG